MKLKEIYTEEIFKIIGDDKKEIGVDENITHISNELLVELLGKKAVVNLNDKNFKNRNRCVYSAITYLDKKSDIKGIKTEKDLKPSLKKEAKNFTAELLIPKKCLINCYKKYQQESDEEVYITDIFSHLAEDLQVSENILNCKIERLVFLEDLEIPVF